MKLSEMSLEQLWHLFPIELTEHRDCWEADFEEEKAFIVSVLGRLNINAQISHIGSTAIKNIMAKPIVDILAELRSEAEMNAAAEALAQNGHIIMSRGENRISLNRGYTENGFAEKVYHVHLRLSGDNGELYFRDYLNGNPAEATEYEKLKLSLLEKFRYNRDAYTEAKGGFIADITDRAKKLYKGRYDRTQKRRIDMKTSINYYMPAKVVTGAKSVETCAPAIAEYGTKALIVTGGASSKKNGSLADLTSALTSKGVRFRVYDKITPNPLLADCIEAGSVAADFCADIIIGLGGGSALDAAKAVAVFAANNGIGEDEFYAKKWDNAPLPIILCGTTAGTGSEVTDVSVLTDSKGRKHSIHDPRLFAKLSIGDPAYIACCPENVLRSTAVDALAHCVESYFTKKADSMSANFALEGAKKVISQLDALYSNPAGADFEELYNASIFGGLAISVTGTAFPHNIGYYLTENYGVPHGYACAVFMPALFAHAEECEPASARRFFEETGITAEELSEKVLRLIPDLGIKLSEEEIDKALPRWENNGTVKNTVGDVGLPFIRQTFLKAFG